METLDIEVDFIISQQICRLLFFLWAAGFVHPEEAGDVNTVRVNNVSSSRLLARRIRDCQQWDVMQSNHPASWDERPMEDTWPKDVFLYVLFSVQNVQIS